MSQTGQDAAGARASHGTLFWAGVALIFLGGLALRSETFTELWTGVHNAWGGAFYGNVARNFLRYGYWTTAFAPVTNSGVVDPSQFELYYHHPPLTMWLTSVSFHLLGIHEWSARLAPLVFSLLTMAVVFSFARAVFDRTTALLALAFMAVLPADAYYATQLDPNSSMAIFFTALAVEGYRRWLARGRDRDHAIIVLAIVLGCLTSWFTYLIVPGILAHFWLTQRQTAARDTWIRALLLPASAVAVFGFFLLHRQIAFSTGRPEIFDPLAERFLKRTVDYELDRVTIMATYLRQIWRLYTLPFIALMAAWVVMIARDAVRRRLQTADWCMAILLSYGVLYALAFPGHLPGHDFFVRTYAPGVALASAAVVGRLARAVRRPVVRVAVIGLVAGIACAIAGAKTRTLYSWDDRSNGPLLRGFGEVVAALTTPRDPVFLPIRDDQVLQFYLDRPTTFDLDTPAKIEMAAASVSGPFLIAVPERNADEFPQLLAYLEQKYPERHSRRLLVFQGGRQQSRRR